MHGPQNVKILHSHIFHTHPDTRSGRHDVPPTVYKKTSLTTIKGRLESFGTTLNFAQHSYRLAFQKLDFCRFWIQQGNLEVTEFLLQICSCDLRFTELCSGCRNGLMFILSCSIRRQKQRSETKRSRLITSWSRFLLEKLTVSQLVKKFPIFYGTRRFITAFTTALPLPPFRAT